METGDSFFEMSLARPKKQAIPSNNFQSRAQLQATWAAQPTTFDGKRPMWETLTKDEFVLFTTPAKLDNKTVQFVRLTTGRKETDGLQYRWRKDGAWVGNVSMVVRHEVFERNGPQKPKGPSIPAGKRIVDIDSPAIVVAASLDQADVCKQLIADGADPDEVDSNGWTALAWAARNNFPKTMVSLIESGADVNHDVFGKTVLMLAAEKGRLSATTALIQAGADIDTRNQSGQTALMLSSHLKIVQALIKGGADLEVKDELGRTALLVAGDAGEIAIFDVLLQAGANVHAVAHDGRSVLRRRCISAIRDMALKQVLWPQRMERIEALSALQKKAGAAYTLWAVSCEAIQHANGDLNAIDWACVEETVAARSIGQNKQSQASVFSALSNHSPGAVTNREKLMLFKRINAVVERLNVTVTSLGDQPSGCERTP